MTYGAPDYSGSLTIEGTFLLPLLAPPFPIRLRHRERVVRRAPPIHAACALMLPAEGACVHSIHVVSWLLFLTLGCDAQENYVVMETPDPSCPCLDDVRGFLQARAPDLFSKPLQPGQCDGFADITGHCMAFDYAQVSIPFRISGYLSLDSKLSCTHCVRTLSV